MAIVIKLGRGGAIAYTKEGSCRIDSVSVENPVDVTGAGDAFDAGFNMCLVAGCSIGQSLFLASVAGAAKTLRRGSSNMPSLIDIIQLSSVTGSSTRPADFD